MMKVRHPLRKVFESCLDTLLPRHCVLCGMASGKVSLCPHCAVDLPRIARGCELCGLPLTLARDRFCAMCLRRAPPWDQALAALTYEFPVDELVRRFKFSHSFTCGKVLGDELVCRIRRARPDPPGCIVPVPLHRARQFVRGFNQAERLARQVGADLSLPVSMNVLARIRRTAAQSGLDSRSRTRNLNGAFRAMPGSAPGHVALVDDVLTTGSTLAACTHALKKAGARRVSIWVAAATPTGR